MAMGRHRLAAKKMSALHMHTICPLIWAGLDMIIVCGIDCLFIEWTKKSVYESGFNPSFLSDWIGYQVIIHITVCACICSSICPPYQTGLDWIPSESRGKLMPFCRLCNTWWGGGNCILCWSSQSPNVFLHILNLHVY